LDLADIVILLLTLVNERETSTKEDFVELLKELKQLGLEKAKNIADLSAMNPMHPLRPSDPVSDAMSLYVETGTHRVAVLATNTTAAQIGNVLTQSAVVSWLAKHVDHLGSLGHKSLKELGVTKKEVFSVKCTDKAVDAFQLMVDKRISAVAVLMEDGTLLSNLSTKDIKEVSPSNLYTKMNKTALEFVQGVHARDVNAVYPSFHCHMTITLKEVILKIALLKVHRLYIVDENHYPIGVISLRDICKILLHK